MSTCSKINIDSALHIFIFAAPTDLYNCLLLAAASSDCTKNKHPLRLSECKFVPHLKPVYEWLSAPQLLEFLLWGGVVSSPSSVFSYLQGFMHAASDLQPSFLD